MPFDHDTVWIDDWFYIDGKWRRLKKTRTPGDIFKYYCDGKKVKELTFKEAKAMHKKLSKEQGK